MQHIMIQKVKHRSLIRLLNYRHLLSFEVLTSVVPGLQHLLQDGVGIPLVPCHTCQPQTGIRGILDDNACKLRVSQTESYLSKLLFGLIEEQVTIKWIKTGYLLKLVISTLFKISAQGSQIRPTNTQTFLKTKLQRQGISDSTKYLSSGNCHMKPTLNVQESLYTYIVVTFI